MSPQIESRSDFFYFGQININQRMTVVKLQGGGLWVHSPVAPTLECMELLEELVAMHGDVKYIVNPTYAVEHKVRLGSTARERCVWLGGKMYRRLVLWTPLHFLDMKRAIFDVRNSKKNARRARRNEEPNKEMS